MSASRKKYKSNSHFHGRSKRPETVFVSSPCNHDSTNQAKNFFENRNSEFESNIQKNNVKRANKNKSNSFGFKNIFGKLFSGSDNDDILIIILIAIIFLSRNRKNEESENDCEEKSEFSVTDFMSKASDILNKFNDNDILLIALLYILL